MASRRRKLIKATMAAVGGGPHDSRYNDRTNGSYYGRRKNHLAPRRRRPQAGRVTKRDSYT